MEVIIITDCKKVFAIIVFTIFDNFNTAVLFEDTFFDFVLVRLHLDHIFWHSVIIN